MNQDFQRTNCCECETGSKDDSLVARNGVHVEAEEGATGHAIHRNPDQEHYMYVITKIN
jgi:hypothetical protein